MGNFKLEDLTESRLVCPYRLFIRARLFSKTRAEEFMNCYGNRCPYYELWNDKPLCKKAEHDYP